MVAEDFFKKAETHEDRVMVSKFTFMKPELTIYHLRNIFKLLEDHYFTIQQLPVLHLMIIFNKVVLKDNILNEASEL